MVKRRFRLGLVTTKPLAQHGVLEYGSDLHVNECQKKRHYHTRSMKNKNKKNMNKKECQMAIFYFTWRARKLCYYGDDIHSFYWKSAVEHDGGV